MKLYCFSPIYFIEAINTNVKEENPNIKDQVLSEILHYKLIVNEPVYHLSIVGDALPAGQPVKLKEITLNIYVAIA